MRILHILHEFPLPANSGIRCDMWRRLSSFHELGHEIFALAWLPEGGSPSPSDMAEVEKSTSRLEIVRISSRPTSSLRRIANLWRYPSYVGARIPDRKTREALFARIAEFQPDLIWLEGIHPCWMALALRKRLKIPLAYRSHNIEHRYLKEQARLSSTAKQKATLYAGTWGLERMERLVHRQADRVFDISADDLEYWREQGFSNNEALAPQPDPDILATASSPPAGRTIDLLFIGGLGAPNNRAGLDWYFRAVHPHIIREIPDLHVTIAGRAPGPDLQARILRAGAELIADPVAVAALYGRARVMFNPILHGSGVNIKTVDMLATGRPVVTTSKGARGLPGRLGAELTVADGEKPFADALVAAVLEARRGCGSADRATTIRDVLGRDIVARALGHFGIERSRS